MYYVYSLQFGNRMYIGCTNNIARRKNQHNGNARKRQSKLGRFLHDSNVVLRKDDFRILFDSSDRHEALAMERHITKSCEAEGFVMLNDNYTKECTRSGKGIGNTAKEFVVINVKEHTFVKVSDLRQYALKIGVSYKGLHSTIKDNSLYKGTYFTFHADEWEKCDTKDDYLSGKYFDEKKKRGMKLFVEKTSKTYEVEFPDGHAEVIHNLDKFAREHDLTGGTLHATLTNGKRTKGYKVLKRIERREDEFRV